MRLALVIFRYFPFGGLQRDMAAIAGEARKRGHEVTVFCGEWEGEKISGVEVVEINTSAVFTAAKVSAFVKKFAQLFSRDAFDLLIGFNKMPGLDVYFAGDSCFAQKAFENRSIFYRLTPRARLYLAYEQAIFGLTSTTRIFSLVHGEQQIFARYYGTPPERINYLPPGIAPEHIHCTDPIPAQERIRRTLGVEATTKIILCLGSGFKTKGVDRSIAAFAELQKTSSYNTVLMVVGADRPDPYFRQAKQLGVANKVHFVGGRSDIADIFQAADVLLHPAYRELAGNVILEAMLTGCPVIASDICGYSPYIVNHGMGEIIAPPYAISQIAQQLNRVLAVDKTLWKIKAQAFASVSNVFSRSQTAVDLIEKIISEHPPMQLIARSHEQIIILRDELTRVWAGQDIFALAENLSGTVAREMHDRQTLRFEVDGKGYFRKWHRGVGWKEIIKNLVQLRLPVLGARNEWEALNKLRALEIPSLVPVAYGEQGTNPAYKKSFIVTRELKDVIQLDHFFEQQQVVFREKCLLLSKVATIARGLHNAGINHRDFYLCHFMLSRPSLSSNPAEPNIFLVDLHRAQCRIKVPRRWLIKDLAGLYFSSLNLNLSTRDILRFLAIYFNQPWRVIITQQRTLLHAVQQRAIKTYRREFGHNPSIAILLNKSRTK